MQVTACRTRFSRFPGRTRSPPRRLQDTSATGVMPTIYDISLPIMNGGVVGYLSVESFASGHHRAHRTRLGRGVVIVEGLDLSGPPMGPYELRVLPLRLTGLDGAPARAVLVG